MWQLMFNGLSLASSLTGLYSFASGFSLDKNVDQIQKSLQRLEGMHGQLLDASRVSRTIVEDVTPIISSFTDLKNPTQQSLSATTLEQIVRSIHREETETTRSILAAVLAEMRTVVDSVRLAQSPPIQTPVNIWRRLIADPYEAGMTGISDISEGGLWAREQPQLVNPMLTPVTWANPLTGQAFLGRMPLSRLRQFGLDLHPPSYPHATDGLIFSERHGLYVPSYLAIVPSSASIRRDY